MSVPIIEKILGNNSIYTTNYLDDCILLTRSVILVVHSEARLYNDYLLDAKGIKTDKSDKTTWRYYHHLAGDYHPTDIPIEMTSWDNGSQITLDKETIIRHKNTRKELLKFGDLYDRLVEVYPEQELLLRTIITTDKPLTRRQIIDLPNYTIMYYNQDLVEPYETNLISMLKDRLRKYSKTRMLPQYGLADNLYLASMYHVTYNFILTTILALRLGNAKTHRAHSYHILSYFASHHNLDDYYQYLSKKQILFLYRNLLYLNEKAGSNEVFDTLVAELLTVEDVSVLNYEFKQDSEPRSDGSMGYRFNQLLLNKTDLVFEERDFELDEIIEIENRIIKGNETFNSMERKEIESSLENTTHSTLRTKNLEVSITDNSNDVKHILADALLNYWAQFLNLGLMDFSIKYIEPFFDRELSLTTEEAFKLFTVALHYYHGQRIETIPDFNIIRVLKEKIPERSIMLYKCWDPSEAMGREVDNLIFNTPTYTYVDTPHDLNKVVMERYLYQLGLWIYLANVGDKTINAQLSYLVEDIHYNTVYKQGDVNVDDFLNEISYPEIKEAPPETLINIVNSLLSTVSSNTMSMLDESSETHKVMIGILDKFKSYSTQFTKGVNQTEAVLTNLGSPFYTVENDKSIQEVRVDGFVPYIESGSIVKTITRIESLMDIRHSSDSSSEYLIDAVPGLVSDAGVSVQVIVNLPVTTTVDIREEDWTPTLRDREQLLSLLDNT